MTFSELDPRTLTVLGVPGALEAAAHPQATAQVLSGLSAHPDSRVRALVARHPNTPLEVLGSLALAFPREVLGMSFISVAIQQRWMPARLADAAAAARLGGGGRARPRR